MFLLNRDVDPTGSHSATVNSPNVTMKITDRGGSDISSAQVGDPLLLRFSIVEKSSEFNIRIKNNELLPKLHFGNQIIYGMVKRYILVKVLFRVQLTL